MQPNKSTVTVTSRFSKGDDLADAATAVREQTAIPLGRIQYRFYFELPVRGATRGVGRASRLFADDPPLQPSNSAQARPAFAPTNAGGKLVWSCCVQPQ